MGSARRTQTFHALENDGVAGVSSWRAIDRRGWAARGRRARALEKNPRSNPSRSLRARLQPESESVYPVLRKRRARRQFADDADDRVPADRRRTCTQYHRCDRAGSAGARFRSALSAAGGQRVWFARRRRRVFTVLLLVRHLSELAWTQRRSARIFRAPARVTKRSRFVVGGIRSARKTIAWKFPASLHPRRTHRGRAVFGREGMTVEPRISRIGWFVPFPGARLTEGRAFARPGRAEARPSGNAGDTTGTTDKSLSLARAGGRDLLTRQCRWIFGDYRQPQPGRCARRGDGELPDKRTRFPKR